MSSPNDPNAKIMPRETLALLIRQRQANGERIVFTNGCFDLLHAGHAHYLSQARALGDALVVGINSDDSVRKLKGDKRPLMVEEDRAFLLASLQAVDYVCAFSEDTPIETLQLLKPDVHVKGGDYQPHTLPETPIVEAYGGQVKILPFLPGRSTTGLVERILNAYALPDLNERKETR